MWVCEYLCSASCLQDLISSPHQYRKPYVSGLQVQITVALTLMSTHLEWLDDLIRYKEDRKNDSTSRGKGQARGRRTLVRMLACGRSKIWILWLISWFIWKGSWFSPGSCIQFNNHWSFLVSEYLPGPIGAVGCASYIWAVLDLPRGSRISGLPI